VTLKDRLWPWVAGIACLILAGCHNDKAPKKHDPTKGTVEGVVICADTGKPARFAEVTLAGLPEKDTKGSREGEVADPLNATETATTDLDGRFTMEAVEPGHYWAYATEEGYLDPLRGLDLERIDKLDGNREQSQEAVKEWKEHLVEVTVHAHRSSEVQLTMERGGEIAGTVSFDDGSPAIGMHFELERKTEKSWTGVGLTLFGEWRVETKSDSRGRFSLTNLAAGEYRVCAVVPQGGEKNGQRVCTGNTLRKKNAKTVKVEAGETVSGVEIVVPLSGLHTVSGTVTALTDGHALVRGTVKLLYADDRDLARTTILTPDGDFWFQYVAEGSYILQVSAMDAEEAAGGAVAAAPRKYKDKEMPLAVVGDMSDVQVTVDEAPAGKAAK
jgi:hypothetical protein